MKRKALEESYKELYTYEMPKWNEDENLMQWLNNLSMQKLPIGWKMV
ncbi:MAG: hypothetical protein ACOX14_08250 [Fermentimonas caenicola]|jgi:integrase/recombinase XerD